MMWRDTKLKEETFYSYPYGSGHLSLVPKLSHPFLDRGQDGESTRH